MLSQDRGIGLSSLGLGREVSLDTQSQPLSPMAFLTSAASGFANSLTVRNATSIAVQEQCRFMLTKSAMENVAALSAFESHLTSMCPAAENRLRLIADNYAINVATRLGRY